MKKVTTTLLAIALASSTVFASESLNILEKTEMMEKSIYGHVQDGSIVDRVGQIDLTVNGNEQKENLNSQVDRLYGEIVHHVSKASLNSQLNAIEWTYNGRVSAGPMLDRVSTLERAINGRVVTASLENRIAALSKVVIGADKQVVMQPATIPETTVFKIIIDTPLSSKNAEVGDTFTFTVDEDITSGNLLVVPEGTKGEGVVTAVKRGRTFGRAGSLEIDFKGIETIGATSFDATQGEEAKERAKTEIQAAGASVAGIALLGPIGVVGGFFVKGKNVEYPAGQAFYVQPTMEIITTGAALELAKPVTAKKVESTTTTVATKDTSSTSIENKSDNVISKDKGNKEATESVAKITRTTSEENLNGAVVVIKKVNNNETNS